MRSLADLTLTSETLSTTKSKYRISSAAHLVSMSLSAPKWPDMTTWMGLLLSLSTQGKPQWDWTATTEQDDSLHHRTVRHGTHLQRPGSETGQAHHLTHGRFSHEVLERNWKHSHRRHLQAVFPHWSGLWEAHMRGSRIFWKFWSFGGRCP